MSPEKKNHCDGEGQRPFTGMDWTGLDWTGRTGLASQSRDKLETVVRSVLGWCEMAASLRGRELETNLRWQLQA
jgi:hypothetical protein